MDNIGPTDGQDNQVFIQLGHRAPSAVFNDAKFSGGVYPTQHFCYINTVNSISKQNLCVKHTFTTTKTLNCPNDQGTMVQVFRV